MLRTLASQLLAQRFPAARALPGTQIATYYTHGATPGMYCLVGRVSLLGGLVAVCK